jgi:hypothetical protein
MFGANRPKREPASHRRSERRLAGGSGSPSPSGGGSSGPAFGGGHSGGGSAGRGSSGPRRSGGKGGCFTTLVIAVVLLAWIFGGDDGGWTGSSASFNIEESEDLLSGPSGDYRWLSGALGPQEKKPYTIMVYMNGSNLESDYGLASTDIQEMLAADVDPQKTNVLVLTGGAKKWRSEISQSLSIYQVGQDSLTRLADLGSGTIADKGLVSAFSEFCKESFPAERYGFVFWYHGGGTLYGYGSDELHGDAGLSISQLRDAFEATTLKNKGFEFIGFDCCLMATIEIAAYLEPYAKYMIASEETEPGTGWDYGFLSLPNANPAATGKEIGKEIVDSYIASNEDGSTEATLSVADLGMLGDLESSFEAFSAAARQDIAANGFAKVSKARKDSRSFGYLGEGQSYDLVDIGAMAENLSPSYPKQAKAVLDSLAKCVVYNKATRAVKGAYGLSTYIPYVSKSVAPENVKAYQKLKILPSFSQFLQNFADKLTGKRVDRSAIEAASPKLDSSGNVAIQLDLETLKEVNSIFFAIWRQMEEGSDYFIRLGMDSDVTIAPDGTIATAFNGYWATLGGREASYFEISKNMQETRYAVPARLNGQRASIIVVVNDENPDGAVLGALPEMSGSVAPKQMIPIADGDRVQLLYTAQLFLSPGQSENGRAAEIEIEGKEFKVSGALRNEVVPVENDLYLYGYWVEDIYNNAYYTDFIEIAF